jgi:hypothetical protein
MPSPETTVALIASGKTTFDEEPGAATAALHRDIEAQNAITPSPINLSIVPQWFRTALDTASRYSASAGHAVAELFGEAGEAGDISEHYCQRLLVPARASLDALGDQGADELGRHVLLERRQPSAHLQEDAREVVEFAQRRGDSADAIEPEVFNVFELAGNAQQRRVTRRFADRIAIAATITVNPASAINSIIALRSIEARKSLAGITVATTQSLKFSGEKVTK